MTKETASFYHNNHSSELIFTNNIDLDATRQHIEQIARVELDDSMKNEKSLAVMKDNTEDRSRTSSAHQFTMSSFSFVTSELKIKVRLAMLTRYEW
jgi:hypothetical protein